MWKRVRVNPRQSEKLSSLPHGTMFGCKNEEVIYPSTMVWNVMEAGHVWQCWSHCRKMALRGQRVLRSHLRKLWKWRLGYGRDPKILEMLEKWGIFQETLHIRRRTILRESREGERDRDRKIDREGCCRQQNCSSGAILSPMNLKVQTLDREVLSFFCPYILNMPIFFISETEIFFTIVGWRHTICF